MSTGNMNAARPQADFLHGMMGWQPNVNVRVDPSWACSAREGWRAT